MDDVHDIPPDRFRDRCYGVATLLLGFLLLPVACLVAPGRARTVACGWALALRYPSQDLSGLTPGTYAAFVAARTEAFWRHGQLIGVTSGHRDAEEQHRTFAEAVSRTGSVAAARRLVLPPQMSTHVRGLALDVRPREGARWLAGNGVRYAIYQTYDNEWWHFEHWPPERGGPPERLPDPSAVLAGHTS